MDKVLELVRDDINEERRRYNKLLLAFLEGEEDIFNKEDLLKIIGELNAAYNHAVSSLAGDNDIYCILKHLSTAIVYAGEIEGEAKALWQIVETLTEGKIFACQACHDEEEK